MDSAIIASGSLTWRSLHRLTKKAVAAAIARARESDRSEKRVNN
jgi:hypothetical protein